jgi:hypothetical protein
VLALPSGHLPSWRASLQAAGIRLLRQAARLARIVFIPLLRERAGPIAQQWEGEGGVHPSLPALTPALSRRERGK